MAALFVAEEWDRVGNPMAALNCQLAIRSAEERETHCMVLRVYDEKERDGRNKVNIMTPCIDEYAKDEVKDKEPDCNWLLSPETYFTQVSRDWDIQTIVGHFPVTSAAAIVLRKQLFPNAKVILINHGIPASLSKNYLKQVEKAHVVFSVGQKVFKYFSAKHSPEKAHELLLPRPDKAFFDLNINFDKRPFPIKQVLTTTVGSRIDCKFNKMLAQAIGKVAKLFNDMKVEQLSWYVRTNIPLKFESIKEKLIRYSECYYITPKINPPYGCQDEWCTELRQSYLCIIPPDESHGMQGLECIAAGLPVLAPKESSVCDLITELCPLSGASLLYEKTCTEDLYEKTRKALLDKNVAARIAEAKELKQKYQNSDQISRTHEQFFSHFVKPGMLETLKEQYPEWAQRDKNEQRHLETIVEKDKLTLDLKMKILESQKREKALQEKVGLARKMAQFQASETRSKLTKIAQEDFQYISKMEMTILKTRLEEAETEKTYLEAKCKELTQTNFKLKTLQSEHEKKMKLINTCEHKVAESEQKLEQSEPQKSDTVQKLKRLAGYFAILFCIIFVVGYCYNKYSGTQSVLHNYFEMSNQCKRSTVGIAQDLPCEDLISVCSSSIYYKDKCNIINGMAGIGEKVHVLPGRFCLCVLNSTAAYHSNIYVQRFMENINMPSMGDFEYIESDVIEISTGNNNSLRENLTLGFWMDKESSARPHSIMTSTDGKSWKQLLSSQAGKIVFAKIHNPGYFIVKSKPYQDSFLVDVNGCEYTSPMSRFLKISIPNRAIQESLVFEVTIVYPNPVLLRAAFVNQLHYQDGLPALSPMIHVRENNGRKIQLSRKAFITLPILSQDSKKMDAKSLKTWIFEDYHMDDRWSDITNDVELYRHRGYVSFSIYHFSGYLTFTAKTSLGTVAFGGISYIVYKYAERLKTGLYPANFLLLQSQESKNILLLECVASENLTNQTKFWATNGYVKSCGGTPHFSRDIDVRPEQRIYITVNHDFEQMGKGARTYILCHPNRKNQDYIRVELHENTMPTEKNIGSVTFVHSDTDDYILYFGIKEEKKEEEGNLIGRGHFQEEKIGSDDFLGRTKDTSSGLMNNGILIIGDEWGTKKGGLSTVNMQIVELARETGKIIYATSLDATQEDREDAESKDIRLLTPSVQDDSDIPDISWLTKHYKTYFESIKYLTDIDIIIGHHPITSTAAIKIRNDWFRSKKLILFSHVIPEETEVYKETWTPEKVQKKERALFEEATESNVHVVFSVGPKIYDHLDNKFRKYPSLTHKLFLPLPDKTFLDIQMKKPSVDGKVQILTIGRVQGVASLKGYDLVACALSQVAAEHRREKPSSEPPQWKIRGVPEGEGNNSKNYINKHINSGALAFKLYPYGSQRDIQDDLQESHLVLMPSRSEPFGMVGLEAIATGTPILLTRNSGLAQFLLKYIDQDIANAVIVNVGYNEIERKADIDEWSVRITQVLNEYDVAFKRAQRLKKLLWENKNIEETHEIFKRECNSDY